MKSRGFSLVETLISLMIVGVILSASMPMMTTVRNKSTGFWKKATSSPADIYYCADGNNCNVGVGTNNPNDARLAVKREKAAPTATYMLKITDQNNNVLAYIDKDGIVGSKGERITTSSTTTQGLTIQGVAGQTANLAEFKNTAGAVITNVNKNGAMGIGIAGADPSAQLHVKSTVAGSITAMIQGFAGQTAHLLDFRNSAGAVLSYIDANGNFSNVPVFPSGMISAFWLAACPAGWTYFGAPGRVLVNQGNNGYHNYPGINSWGGEDWHTLSTAEMPAHFHQQGSEALYNVYGGGVYIGERDWGVHDSGYSSIIKQNTSTVGGNAAHENRMPFVSVLYCSKN
jgi:prepilin-type N-terminal cleavage/methylation domain-containing protein